MRLIDADALNKELQQRVGSPTDDKLYEVNLCIIDAPIIDAIPVEWIMKWSNKRYRETQRDVSIVDVLAAWQKEQEAQECSGT